MKAGIIVATIGLVLLALTNAWAIALEVYLLLMAFAYFDPMEDQYLYFFIIFVGVYEVASIVLQIISVILCIVGCSLLLAAASTARKIAMAGVWIIYSVLSIVAVVVDAVSWITMLKYFGQI